MIYKLFRAPELSELVAAGETLGSAVDRADGYVHFSTEAQLPGTAAKHFAGEAGLSPVRLAVAWVLAQEGVTCAILGARGAAQLPEQLAAAETTLDLALLARLDQRTREFRMGDATR